MYTALDLVESFLRRFIAYPSEHAVIAHSLWIAHTHLIEHFDTTARLAFMSAEKESGKTRALEVTALLVADPLLAFSLSPAVCIRLVSARRRTVLYDEIDAVFGSAKRQEDNGQLCAFFNAGYTQGARAYRCATNGRRVETEEFDAFAPVAVAGLRTLPDTIASRSIFIRMKRRAPDEEIESFRQRYARDAAKPIKEELEEWCEKIAGSIIGAEPCLPAGIIDRAADIWAPLFAIADAAGDDWPKRARVAAVYLTAHAREESQTRGVELLEHIREAFGDEDKLFTATLLRHLCDRDESPWRDVSGGKSGKEKPLTDRGLASRLRLYGIGSKTVRIGDATAKGYDAVDFYDAWDRYCLPSRHIRHNRYIFDNENNNVTDVTDVTPGKQKEEATTAKAFEERAAKLDPDLPDFLRRRP